MSVDETHLSRLHQVHGAAVVVRRPGESAQGEALPAADIIISTDPSAAVAVQTADCVPILLVDPESGAVAAAHAGWRGLAARVPAAAVRGLVEAAAASPDSLHAAIGPAISAARYEVGADVRARFESAGFTRTQIDRWFPAITRADHWLFDGWESARAQLEEAGVRADRISVAALCTATYPDLFCSYRRDGAPSGRMAAAIKSRPR
jgi:YfiH family protein